MEERFIELEDIRGEPGAYVLLCDSGKYLYKGSARNLRRRLADHFEGSVSRTRNRRPIKIVHCEYTDDYTEARKRENWLKSGQGRKWLK